MRLWLILRSRLRSLFFPGRRESDLRDELQFHLERETERLEASGLSRTAAHVQARRLFGGAEPIKEACRDARGIRFLDDAVRDIRDAVRGFVRAPLVAFTVVFTVALGLGLVAVAFTFLNMFLFRVDQVPKIDELFALEQPRTAGAERPPFTRAHLDALRRETDVFTDAYGELSGIDVTVEGRRLLSTFVTGNFFQIVGVNAARGRTLTPADDEPSGGRPVMVISDRGWDRMFARAPDVIGRTVLVGNTPFEVVGMMPEGFRGLGVMAPDYWMPLAMAGRVRDAEQGAAHIGIAIIGRLKPGMSRETAVAGLSVWASAQSSGSPADRSAAGVTLVPRRGTINQPLDAVLVTAPLFFAFGLVLLIGCANVANLLLARGVTRQREIGIRLSLGAGRRRIIRQLLTESLLLALIAGAAGFAISRVALRVLVDAMMTSWPPEIGDLQLLVPVADWRVMLFLTVGAGASTVCFGLFPALHATRIDLISTMRGEVVRQARPGRARDVLIGLQVSVSALLLICSAVFLRSALVAATVDAGMRTSNMVIVGIKHERVRTPIVQAVTSEPSVAAVAASWPPPFANGPTAFAEAAGAKATVAYRFVSSEYFDVLDIALVRGRRFTPAERSPNLSVAIVSETTARALWPNADAIGQVMRLDLDRQSPMRPAGEPTLDARTFTVIGVVRDVQGFRILPLTKFVVYVPTSDAMARTALVARVHGDADVARQTIVNRVASIDPTVESGLEQGVGSMTWLTKMEVYLLQVGFFLTIGVGALALTLTLSGLFSVLSYLVEQRTKEIGVRMALGATTHHVSRLVLTQSIRPVAAGLLIGAIAAAGLSALLLATPAAAIVGQIIRVRDPIAYGASLLVILAACLAAASIPALRASRLDPTRTLRQE